MHIVERVWGVVICPTQHQWMREKSSCELRYVLIPEELDDLIYERTKGYQIGYRWVSDYRTINQMLSLQSAVFQTMKGNSSDEHDYREGCITYQP